MDKSNNSWVKRSLASHSWLGLFVAAVLFLICLTGSFVVLFEEFERWEQPNVEEYLEYSPAQIQTAVDEFLLRVEQVPKSLYVVLPTKEVPRIHIAGDGQEWFVNRDGSLSDAPVEGWTHFLKEMHINLHLPQTFGIIVVGVFGAMLCGLIVSGIIAHPRIFKDAFTWRRHKSERLNQVDLHNRLSVWGTPFYFMIGLTGAFIGLVSIFIAASAGVFFNNDRDAVVNAVYGAEPKVTRSQQNINYRKAFENLQQYAPEATPIYLVIQNKGSEQQFLEVAATLPGRLIYSELYQLSSNGDVISHQGMSDGAAGRQVAYSVYRLHFGHFAGFPVKVLYVALGICLTVICASGVNIWLTRRKHQNFINDCWVAMVWGSPLALASAMFSIFISVPALIIFLVMFAISAITALMIKNTIASKRLFQLTTGMVLLLVALMHWQTFGFNHRLPVVHGVNITLTLVGFFLLWQAKLSFKSKKEKLLELRSKG